MAVLKKLGWDKDLTPEEMATITSDRRQQRRRGELGDRPVGRHPARLPRRTACMPYGNGKARANAWNLPDPIPVHREPIYTPRPDLVAKYPTRPDERQFRMPNIGFSVQKAAVDKNIAKEFPIILTSGRLVEYEGGGEETRSNRWLAELQQDMFVEINTADAAERGIKDGAVGLGLGAENGAKARVKALVTDRVGKGVAWMPFHFCGLVPGRGHARQLPEGHRPDRARRERQHGHDLRLRSGDGHAGNQGHALPDPSGVREERHMARMKFLCDADRCIECNACVTACKNEHDVPWGINRRRVVTHQRRQAGRALDLDGLHALHRRALRGGVPGQLLLHHGRRGGAALEGPVHRLRLLLLRLPVRRAAISARSAISARAARWTNAPTARAARKPTTRTAEYEKYGSQPSGRRQAAALRRDVLDQGAARRRRRDHRPDLQGARGQARLRLGRLGLEDGLRETVAI